MKGKYAALSVGPRQSVENVLTYLENLGPNTSVSVVEICKLAKVSRANLYSSYPDLVAKIKLLNKMEPPDKNSFSQSRISQSKVGDLRKVVSALIAQCIELQLENESLAKQLKAKKESEEGKNGSRSRKMRR